MKHNNDDILNLILEELQTDKDYIDSGLQLNLKQLKKIANSQYKFVEDNMRQFNRGVLLNGFGRFVMKRKIQLSVYNNMSPEEINNHKFRIDK